MPCAPPRFSVLTPDLCLPPSPPCPTPPFLVYCVRCVSPCQAERVFTEQREYLSKQASELRELRDEHASKSEELALLSAQLAENKALLATARADNERVEELIRWSPPLPEPTATVAPAPAASKGPEPVMRDFGPVIAPAMTAISVAWVILVRMVPVEYTGFRPT